MGDKTIIDVEEALERVQDDKELFLELLDIFQKDYEEKYGKLLKNVKNAHADGIRDIAHSVKGAAGNISAKQIQACCSEMEEMAEKNQLDHMREKMDDLEQAYGRLKIEIAGIKKEMGGA